MIVLITKNVYAVKWCVIVYVCILYIESLGMDVGVQ